jgi:hypothetical protein
MKQKEVEQYVDQQVCVKLNCGKIYCGLVEGASDETLTLWHKKFGRTLVALSEIVILWNNQSYENIEGGL